MNNKKKAITEGAALNNSVTGADGLWKGFDLQSHLIRDNVRSGYFVSGSCCRSEAEGLGKRWRNQRTEILSLEPRVFRYRNFLSKEECQYLIRHGTPYMTRSEVSDTESGKSYHSSSRTSTGMFMRRGQDKIIGDIEKRIADFTFIPVEHGEGLQVLRYEVGQKNLPHYDTDTSVEGPITENGGPRIATVLMYLSDVEKGGETVFPSAKRDAMSKHGKKGLTVKPKMGDALLFWSIKPDGTLDPSSLHGGAPVIKGTKWACTKWLHAQEYSDSSLYLLWTFFTRIW